ncbi:hypothetical protein Py17XNL_001002401 [Plasmodium yoelii yoelii]|uniref:Uncharacterized protein n=1 Tax=Plasmodium yoelii yoelii TaxID=73239 RepID=A0AAF0B4Q8_PLAYO|nr:hypothetical protein Py17XNL_001002401 [Plasmodium yoelii yoelii]
MANKKIIKPHNVTEEYLFQNIDHGIYNVTDAHNILLEEKKKKFAQKYENKREELIRIINNSLVENMTNDDLKFTFQNTSQESDLSIEPQKNFYEYASSIYLYYGFNNINVKCTH